MYLKHCESLCSNNPSSYLMSQGYFSDGVSETITRRQPVGGLMSRGIASVGAGAVSEYLYTPQSELPNLPAKRGNNRFGAAGTRKCRRCRSRKTRVLPKLFASDLSVFLTSPTPRNLAKIASSKGMHYHVGKRLQHKNSRPWQRVDDELEEILTWEDERGKICVEPDYQMWLFSLKEGFLAKRTKRCCNWSWMWKGEWRTSRVLGNVGSSHLRFNSERGVAKRIVSSGGEF